MCGAGRFDVEDSVRVWACAAVVGRAREAPIVLARPFFDGAVKVGEGSRDSRGDDETDCRCNVDNGRGEVLCLGQCTVRVVHVAFESVFQERPPPNHGVDGDVVDKKGGKGNVVFCGWLVKLCAHRPRNAACCSGDNGHKRQFGAIRKIKGGCRDPEGCRPVECSGQPVEHGVVWARHHPPDHGKVCRNCSGRVAGPEGFVAGKRAEPFVRVANRQPQAHVGCKGGHTTPHGKMGRNMHLINKDGDTHIFRFKVRQMPLGRCTA